MKWCAVENFFLVIIIIIIVIIIIIIIMPQPSSDIQNVVSYEQRIGLTFDTTKFCLALMSEFKIESRFRSNCEQLSLLIIWYDSILKTTVLNSNQKVKLRLQNRSAVTGSYEQKH